MFYDAEDLGVMAKGEHDGCTHVEWDPTGRYVISAASFNFSKVCLYFRVYMIVDDS
jgi:hypothetical protein